MTSKIALLGALAAMTAGTFAVGMDSVRAQDQTPLRVAMNADPDVLDMTQSTNPPQGLATMDNVYEACRRSDPKGTNAPGWPSPGTSRTAARSSSCISATASNSIRAIRSPPKDVVWSHERMSEEDLVLRAASRASSTKVEAVDDYTVKFTFKQPDAQFLPVPALIIASKTYFDRVGEKEFAKHPGRHRSLQDRRLQAGRNIST